VRCLENNEKKKSDYIEKVHAYLNYFSTYSQIEVLVVSGNKFLYAYVEVVCHL
jgi:hypothetical protein